MPSNRPSQEFVEPERTARDPAPLGAAAHDPAGDLRDLVPPPDPPLRVRVRFSSVESFVESQARNVSLSGMFIATTRPSAVGRLVDFECVTAEEQILLHGRAEVAWVSEAPPGMGLRFRALDGATLRRVEEIVRVNREEGRVPTVALDFAVPLDRLPPSRGLVGATAVSSAVRWTERGLALQLNPITVGYFVSNPLLNQHTGGFVVPAERDLPLGATLDVLITNMSGQPLFKGKATVSAKQDLRLGLKLDRPGTALERLRAEVEKLAPADP